MTESQRVLIADDHEPSARAACASLAQGGYDVAAAGNLDDAASLLRARPPVVIILDAGLPGGNVEEFCRRILEGRDGKDMRTILVVPPRFPREKLARLQPLSDVHLFKPFRVRELKKHVRELTDAEPARPSERVQASEEAETGGFDLAGAEVGGCKLERLLGRGANGAVYLGRHLLLDVPVALKVMPVALASWRPEELERFLRGARAAARVLHPNVVPVLNAGREENFYFLVHRYAEGESLKDRLGCLGRLPEDAVISILRDIASGLGAAHRLGIVHRDVKPGNIIIKPNGTAVLTDFGLARAVGQGDISSGSDIVGTPYYMSPEQCSGLPIDGRSDLYSLGATAYHALTGRRPAQGDSAIAVLRAHMEETPPAPRSLVSRISEGVSALVMRLLAKDREQRYQSAEELVIALRNVESRSEDE